MTVDGGKISKSLTIGDPGDPSQLSLRRDGSRCRRGLEGRQVRPDFWWQSAELSLEVHLLLTRVHWWVLDDSEDARDDE